VISIEVIFFFDFSLIHLLNLAKEILSDLITSLPVSPNPRHIDPTAYSILMTGYNLHNQPEKTVMTFDLVQYPDAISYLLSFQACSQLKDLQRGQIFAKLQTALFDVSRKRFSIHI
jgi:hypothetical protein